MFIPVSDFNAFRHMKKQKKKIEKQKTPISSSIKIPLGKRMCLWNILLRKEEDDSFKIASAIGLESRVSFRSGRKKREDKVPIDDWDGYLDSRKNQTTRGTDAGSAKQCVGILNSPHMENRQHRHIKKMAFLKRYAAKHEFSSMFRRSRICGYSW